MLTRSELAILKLICEGLSSKEVGAKLKIATNTVETHRANINRKVGAKNRVQLFRWAMANGIVKPPKEAVA